MPGDEAGIVRQNDRDRLVAQLVVIGMVVIGVALAILAFSKTISAL